MQVVAHGTVLGANSIKHGRRASTPDRAEVFPFQTIVAI